MKQTIVIAFLVALLPLSTTVAYADCGVAVLAQQQCQSQGQGQTQSVNVAASPSQSSTQHVNVSTSVGVSVPVNVTIVTPTPPAPPSAPLVWLSAYEFFWWAPTATGYVVSWQEYGQTIVTDVGGDGMSQPFGGCVQVAAYNAAGVSGWSRAACGAHGAS